MARAFQDLTPKEQGEAIDEIVTQWMLILADRAKNEAQADFTGRLGWRK